MHQFIDNKWAVYVMYGTDGHLLMRRQSPKVWWSLDAERGRIAKKQKICRDKLSWSIRNSPLVFWLHAYWRRRLRLKYAIFACFKPPWPWPDLESCYASYRRVSLIYLYLHYILFKSENFFVGGRTDVRTTDGFITSNGAVDLKVTHTSYKKTMR